MVFAKRVDVKKRKASEIQNAILKTREIHTKWTKFETHKHTHTHNR